MLAVALVLSDTGPLAFGSGARRGRCRQARTDGDKSMLAVALVLSDTGPLAFGSGARRGRCRHARTDGDKSMLIATRTLIAAPGPGVSSMEPDEADAPTRAAGRRGLFEGRVLGDPSSAACRPRRGVGCRMLQRDTPGPGAAIAYEATSRFESL